VVGSSGSGSPIPLGAAADLGCGHLKDFFTLVSGTCAGTRGGPGVAGAPGDSLCLCAVPMRSLQHGGFGGAGLLESSWGS